MYWKTYSGVKMIKSAKYPVINKGNYFCSWLEGVCRWCGFPVVGTQPTKKYCDYWWYCSNKKCKMHKKGEQLSDTEIPNWVSLEEFIK